VYLPKRALVERQAECLEDAKGKSTEAIGNTAIHILP
jgi:hypothetical protein